VFIYLFLSISAGYPQNKGYIITDQPNFKHRVRTARADHPIKTLRGSGFLTYYKSGNAHQAEFM
jgi:hypothetical protein